MMGTVPVSITAIAPLPVIVHSCRITTKQLKRSAQIIARKTILSAFISAKLKDTRTAACFCLVLRQEVCCDSIDQSVNWFEATGEPINGRENSSGHKEP